MPKFTAGLELEVTAGEDLDRLVHLYLDTARQQPLSWDSYSAFYSSLKSTFDDTTELVVLTVTGSLVDKDGNAVTSDDGWLRVQADRSITGAVGAPAKATIGNVGRGVWDIFAVDASGEQPLIARGTARLFAQVTTTKPA